MKKVFLILIACSISIYAQSYNSTHTGAHIDSVIARANAKITTAGAWAGNVIDSSKSSAKVYSINGLKGTVITKLTANTTVNFTSGMSTATIQALINAQPKDLGTYILTFQFGDGTYSLGAVAIDFSRFSNGSINIYGKTSESSVKYTTQSVVLNTTAVTGVNIGENTCRVAILNITVNNTSGIWSSCIAVTNCSNYVEIGRCYFYNNVLGAHNILITNVNHGRVAETYAKGTDYGLYVIGGSTIFVKNNASIATIPITGTNAMDGSLVVKENSVNFTGSTNNETATYGGLFR